MTSHRPHLLPTTTGAPHLQPSRRQHVDRPPTLLTTALSAAHNQNPGLSAASPHPLSTTSLSAPFSPYPSSPHPPSSTTEMRGSSPMATRTQASFSAPYNPQQWGLSASSTSTPLDTASRTRQSAHPSRFPRFAPRPVGPDGKRLWYKPHLAPR